MAKSMAWRASCVLMVVTWLGCTGVPYALGTSETPAAAQRDDSSQEATGTPATPQQGTSDSLPEQPGESDRRGAEAEARPQAGPDADVEIHRLKERILELQSKGKLGFRKVVPCTAVDSFGVYSPLVPESNVSKILLYVEPMNFTTLVTKDRYIIDLSVDIFAYDLSGKLIVGKENVLRINRVSRSPILDLYYKIELNLAKHTGQDFVIKTALHDKLKNQSVSTVHRIKVARKGGKPGEGI